MEQFSVYSGFYFLKGGVASTWFGLKSQVTIKGSVMSQDAANPSSSLKYEAGVQLCVSDARRIFSFHGHCAFYCLY